MLIALARKLAISLWRYVETGLVPDGAVMAKTTPHMAAAAYSRAFKGFRASRVRERGDGQLEDMIGVSRAGKKCDPVSSIVCTVHAGLWQAIMELPDIS